MREFKEEDLDKILREVIEKVRKVKVQEGNSASARGKAVRDVIDLRSEDLNNAD